MTTDNDASDLPPGRMVRSLDETDLRLLDALARDGRISIRALAERLHVSRTNAYARLERLIADGVITGFQARIHHAAAGLGTSAYVSIGIRQNTWREVSQALRAVPYVEHIALIAGEHDVLALVRAPSNDHLRAVVLDRIQGIAGVLTTRTWLIFEESHEPPHLLP